MLSHDLLKPLMPPIKRNRHKYEAGYVVGLAGSPSYARSCHAFVAGVFARRCRHRQTACIRPEWKTELSTSPYELIRVPYNLQRRRQHRQTHEQSFSDIRRVLAWAKRPEAKKLLLSILPKLEKPCVIDADALNDPGRRESADPKTRGADSPPRRNDAPAQTTEKLTRSLPPGNMPSLCRRT